jgi:hypothetical protein
MRMKRGRTAFAAASVPTSIAIAISIAISLGGCASTVNIVGDPFVQPEKFHFLRCEDIAKRLVSTRAREQELRTLMDRAAAGAGGSAVNLVVYQPEYQTVTSELQQLRAAAAEKNCPPEKPEGKKADSKK